MASQLGAQAGDDHHRSSDADRRGKVGIELVQVPPQPVDHPRPLGDQVLAPVDQQLQLPRHLIVGGDRQVGLRQCGPRDRERVDRVGLAPLTSRAAGAGHQLRLTRTTCCPAAEQVPLQQGGQVPAVLDRPQQLSVLTCSGPNPTPA